MSRHFAMATSLTILAFLLKAGFLIKLGSCESFTCSTPDEWFGIHNGPHPDGNGSLAQALHTLTDHPHWPDAHVFYEVSRTLNDSKIPEVFEAFREYHAKTCVRFVPATLSSQKFTNIEVDNSVSCGLGSVCMNKENYVRVDNNCTNAKALIHELGHNLCLTHEHQRHDRDDYVEVSPACKTNEKNWGKLEKGSGYKSRGIYDYASIMHYGCGKCINPKNTAIGNKCGEHVSDGLSLLDADYINELYNCGGCFRHRWIPVDQLTREQKIHLPTSQISPCRAPFDTEIVVGTYHPLDKTCYLAFNGKEEKRQEEFELLLIPGGWVTADSEYSWVEGHRNMPNYVQDALFANAVPAGRMTWKLELGSATGYVGYASLKYNSDCKVGPNTVDLIGMIRRYHDGLRSSFAMVLCGKEKQADEVKVLVCKSKLPHPLPTPKTLMERDLYRNWKQRHMRRVDFQGRESIPITIDGNILPNASEIYVDIAKQTAAGEILLHLRFLLSPNAPTKLTVSALSETGWPGESHITLADKFWFKSENNFKLRIHYERKGGFGIRLNDFPVTTFAHKLPVPERGFIRIHGDTIITHLDVKSGKSEKSKRITSPRKEETNEGGQENGVGLWRDHFDDDYFGDEAKEESSTHSGHIVLTHQSFITFLALFSVCIIVVVVVITTLVMRLRRFRRLHYSHLSVSYMNTS